MAKEYLFVYGTLRKEFELSWKAAIAQQLLFVGTGNVNGTLYDLGDYPGAVKGGDAEILGDIFEIKDTSILEVLDVYEGEEYKREKESITLTTGKTIDAWMYCYFETTANRPVIRNRDYLDYLKNKTDRFV